MKKPELSILVACHNVEAYLPTCLDSILSQRGVTFEVICVDDASTDATGRLLVEAAKRDGRLKIITHDANRGTLLARKTAIEAATGEWALFVDGDDRLNEGAALKALQLVKNSQSDCGVFGVSFIAEAGQDVKPFEEYFRLEDRRIEGTREILKDEFVTRRFSWNLWNKIYSIKSVKAAAKDIRDEKIIQGDDFQLSYLIAARLKTVVVSCERLYDYRLGTGVSTNPEMSIAQFLRYCDYVTSCKRLCEWIAVQDKTEDFAESRDGFIAHTARMFDNILFKRMDCEVKHRALNLYKQCLKEAGLYDQFTGGREMSNFGFEQLRSPIEEMTVLTPAFGNEAMLFTIAATGAEAREVSVSVASAIRAAKRSVTKADIVVISGDLSVRDRARLEAMTTEEASVRLTDKLGFEETRFESLKAKTSLAPGEVVEGEDYWESARETSYYEELLRKRFAAEIRETFDVETARWEKKMAGVVSMYEDVLGTTSYRIGYFITAPLRLLKRVGKKILGKGV